MNAPHAFGLRESKPNAMHAYGRSSAPIAQGLVYDMRTRILQLYTMILCN